jgi:hypothetical protein
MKRLLFTIACLSLLINTFAQFSGGDGSQSTPYLISNTTDIATLRTKITSGVAADISSYQGFTKYYRLSVNIDMTGVTGFTSIGTSGKPFQGKFDGNGFKISNLTIGTSLARVIVANAGFFGTTSGAEIKNTTFENVSIYNGTYSSGTSNNGAVATNPIASTVISNCHVTGTINSVNGKGTFVGGIAGNLIGSTIINCSADVLLTAQSTLTDAGYAVACGGLVGSLSAADNNYGYVYNSFSTGSVSIMNASPNVVSPVSTSNSYGGGIAGTSATGSTIKYNIIDNCYSTTTVSVTSSNTSGNAYAGGILGNLGQYNQIKNSVALNSSLTTNGITNSKSYRITGAQSTNTTLASNYGIESMSLTNNNVAYNAVSSATGKDGANIGSNVPADLLTLYANGKTTPVNWTLWSALTAIAENGNGITTGSGTYFRGSTKTINVTPNANYTFVDWTVSGSQVSTNSSFTLTVPESNTTYQANFSSSGYLISISANNASYGNVSGGGSKADGSTVNLTATANAGYLFVNWTEGGSEVSTNVSYSFQANAARTLIANFRALYNYNIDISGINGTVGGGGSKTEGSSVTITATANSGYRFVSWSEDASIVANTSSYTFTAAADRTLVANFMVPFSNTVSTDTNISDIANAGAANITITGTNTKLTVDTPTTINSLAVSSGTKLDLSSALTVIGNVVLKVGKNTAPNVYVETGMVSLNGLTLEKTLDNTKWYFISFPTNVVVNNIIQRPPTDNGTLTLGTNYWIRYYDGLHRATNGKGGNWIEVTAGQTLNAKQGYIIGLDNSLTGDYILSFPLTKTILQSADASSLVPVTAYGVGTAAANNIGWNLVGQPYLSSFNAQAGTNAPYMVLHNGSSYVTYSSLLNELPTNLLPFDAYFVQADADLQTSGITFNAISRQNARKSVVTNTSDIFKIELNTATGTDKTFLILSDEQNVDYQVGQDMEKWLTTGNDVPQIYTLIDNISYAYNALPAENVQNLSLGIYNKTIGTNTITANAVQAGSIEELILTDKLTGISTNLLASSYTFEATTGIENSRFVLTIHRIPTDNNLIKSGVNEPSISMVNGKLKLNNLSAETTIKLYNAIGQIVFNNVAYSTSLEIPLRAVGMYTIQIESGTKKWSKKIINNK